MRGGEGRGLGGEGHPLQLPQVRGWVVGLVVWGFGGLRWRGRGRRRLHTRPSALHCACDTRRAPGGPLTAVFLRSHNDPTKSPKPQPNRPTPQRNQPSLSSPPAPPHSLQKPRGNQPSPSKTPSNPLPPPPTQGRARPSSSARWPCWWPPTTRTPPTTCCCWRTRPPTSSSSCWRPWTRRRRGPGLGFFGLLGRAFVGRRALFAGCGVSVVGG